MESVVKNMGKIDLFEEIKPSLIQSNQLPEMKHL